MPMFARRPSTKSSPISVDIPQNPMIGKQRQQISELQFHKFLNPQSFLVWRVRFKNQVTTCSDFPSEAMLWIREVQMVDSLDKLKSSRSVSGKNFPNFEMLDAKIASAEQDHPEFPIREEGQSRGTESPERGSVPARKTDRLHDLRLFSSGLALLPQYWIMLIYSLLFFMTIMFRNSIRDGMKFYYPCQRFHPMMSWKVCTN